MRALCEWASGDFIDLSTPSCEAAMHLQTIRSRLLTKLVDNKFRETKSCQTLWEVVNQGTSYILH